MNDAITISSVDGETTATFLPEANFICSELRHAGSDWLDPVRASEAQATGKDYGISLVYPWAGRLARFRYQAAGIEVSLSVDDDQLPRDKSGLPIHGVWGRLLRWSVVEHSPQRLVGQLSWNDKRLLDVFPFPHDLRFTASIGTGRLRLETELSPTAQAGVPVAFGFHAFLRVPDSPRTAWTISHGARQRLLLDEKNVPTGERVPVAQSEVSLGDEVSVDEDVAGFDNPCHLSCGDGQKTVLMELEKGFAVAHLFAPAGRDLVSFEPMTAPANALNSGENLRIIEPGDSYRTVMSIDLAA